jgi:hypothetical protein
VHDVVVDGLVEDVSRSGVFLRAPKMLRLGANAEIDIDLPGERPLRMQAEIVRVEQRPRSGMGLRFIGDADRAARPLANFIMRQHATTR